MTSKKLKKQSGGILIEMSISVAVLFAALISSLDLGAYLRNQDDLSNVVYSTAELIREYQVFPDDEEMIDYVKTESIIFLEQFLTENGYDPADFTINSNVYTTTLPNSLQGVAYLWLGIKSNKSYGILNWANIFQPCKSTLIPMNILFGEIPESLESEPSFTYDPYTWDILESNETSIKGFCD